MGPLAAALPFVGPALGIAGAIFGDDEASTPSGTAQANIANQLWNTTQPVRGNLLDSMTQFTGGDYNFADNPAFAPGKNMLENQYGVAQDNIMAMMPRGGQLYDALAQNENARAGAQTQLGGTIGSDMLNKAYQAAFQTPGQSLMGLQGASQAEQYGQDANNQMWGDIGGFVGNDLPGLIDDFVLSK